MESLGRMPKHVFYFMYAVAKYMPLAVRRIMFKSIIDGFGGKFKCFVVGGAPLEVDVAEFLKELAFLHLKGMA